MGALRDRLRWDEASGAPHDGQRRYLMLRPDVLMGAIVALDAPLRAAVLDALAASAQQHGARSLRAYAGPAPGDAGALIAATVQAAADLGWGRWRIARQAPQSLTLEVSDSPFAAGWRAATASDAPLPVCGPIRGMLAGLAEQVLGAAVQVDECECAAAGQAARCRFVARVTA